MIAKQTGGKHFEIKTKKAYPKNYKKCTAVAEREQKNNARPKLKTKVKKKVKAWVKKVSKTSKKKGK